jgi:hypothetical protein
LLLKNDPYPMIFPSLINAELPKEGTLFKVEPLESFFSKDALFI